MPGLSGRCANFVAGLKHAASWLRLINPCRSSSFSSPDKDAVPLGPIAIALSCQPLEHSGLFYTTQEGVVRVLHLAGHRNIKNDSPADCPEFICVVPDILPRQMNQIAELCCLAAQNRPLVDFGFKYHESSLFSLLDATFTTASGTIGLTCCTFVVTLLRAAGIRPFKIKTFRITSAAISSQRLLVHYMAPRNPMHATDFAMRSGQRD